MRSLKVAAITAALILIPIGVVHATQISPGGPASFTCKPWATLPPGAKVIAITPTSVTFFTAFDDLTERWVYAKSGGVTYQHLLVGQPPTPYDYILTPEDIAAHPNLAVNSIHTHAGMIVRRSYSRPPSLGIWHCTY